MVLVQPGRNTAPNLIQIRLIEMFGELKGYKRRVKTGMPFLHETVYLAAHIQLKTSFALVIISVFWLMQTMRF